MNFYPAYGTPTQASAPSPYQASGYGAALGAFGNYRGNMDGLSAPFYPMLYGAFSQLLPQMGADPFGNAVRQASQGGPQISPAEYSRQQYETQKALREEQARQASEQRDAMRAKQDAWTGSDEYRKLLSGMTPDNRRIWDLMYRM